MRAVITGVGWAGPQGLGRPPLPIDGAPPAPWPLGPGPLLEISRSDVRESPDKTFGRLDPFCRLGLGACAQALRDAGLHPDDAVRTAIQGMGMILATFHGCLHTDQAFVQTLPPLAEAPSPLLFAYTLPGILLGEAALRFDLRGPALALQAPVVTSAGSGEESCAALERALNKALAVGLDMLSSNEAPAMLVGFCDLGPLAPTPDALGGALFLVLEKTAPPAYPGRGVCERHADRVLSVVPEGPGSLPPVLVRAG